MKTSERIFNRAIKVWKLYLSARDGDKANRLRGAYDRLRMAHADWRDYEEGEGPHPKEYTK